MNPKDVIAKKANNMKLAKVIKTESDDEASKNLAEAYDVVRQERSKVESARETARKRFINRVDPKLKDMRNVLEDVAGKLGAEAVAKPFEALKEFENAMRSLVWKVAEHAVKDMR